MQLRLWLPCLLSQLSSCFSITEVCLNTAPLLMASLAFCSCVHISLFLDCIGVSLRRWQTGHMCLSLTEIDAVFFIIISHRLWYNLQLFIKQKRVSVKIWKIMKATLTSLYEILWNLCLCQTLSLLIKDFMFEGRGIIKGILQKKTYIRRIQLNSSSYLILQNIDNLSIKKYNPTRNVICDRSLSASTI